MSVVWTGLITSSLNPIFCCYYISSGHSIHYVDEVITEGSEDKLDQL